MTQRLYYDDATTTDFTARVVQRLTHDNQPAVVLDQTYFYPTGGGQPHDTGTIDGVAVLDVFTRLDDGAVLHVLAGEVATDEVACRVDWARRFDHMQHHTGQHILSQAFIQVADANTIGFHLSPDSVTIDVDAGGLPPDTAHEAEDLANRIIHEDRPVIARLLAPGEAPPARMRKIPDHLATDTLRIVEIEDFDLTACGGTHVSRAGQVGLVKIIKLERRGDGTRVEFRCGQRALEDYRAKNALANRLAAEFTVGHWEVDEAVARLKDELKDTRRALKQARTQLLTGEADRLLAAATERDGLRLVRAAFGGDASPFDVGDVRALASRLVESDNTLVLFGIAGDSAQLIVARSEALPHDMAAVLKHALETLGDGKGGGRPDFAQGGGLAADEAQIEAALDAAERAIFSG